MEISDDYPNALLEDFPPYGARLLTAVHIACIDAGGEAFGLEFSEDELQDFFDTNTHRYFSVKPRGNLKKAVDLLLKAVCTSIQNNELKLLAVRKNLEGELSLANSWVSFDNFAEWCETRSINLGDCWFDFCKDDSDIANSAAEEMDTTRRRLEGFLKETDVADLREKLDSEGIDWLLDEAALLRAKIKKLEEKTAAKQEKPLTTRERNTLLAIIAALCNEAKIDHTKPSKAADYIQSTADKMGLSTSKRGIEEHLKKIPDMLASRMK